MNVSLFISARYLFAHQRRNAIHTVSTVAVCGVALVTVALVVALSVYNGFDHLVASWFSRFDPDIKILPRAGKVFIPAGETFQQVRQMEEISTWSEVLYDNALVRYQGRQEVALIKGVEENFRTLTQIDSLLIDGRFALQEEVVSYATVGVGLAAAIGVRAGFTAPLEIYLPKRDQAVNAIRPETSFATASAFVAGIFGVNQQVYDNHLVLIPLSLARSLLRYPTQVSAIEIALLPGTSPGPVIQKIQRALGKDFIVQDRYRQQENSFRMMQIEKWITFLILCFVLIIALFNITGSLSMLIIEKQADAATLAFLGAHRTTLTRIFLFQGWMIAALGAAAGTLIGLGLCLLQQHTGLIQLGPQTGAFLINAYPVKVIWTDLVIIFFTVLTIGFLAARIPLLRHPGPQLSEP